jgi:hypothetical protein
MQQCDVCLVVPLPTDTPSEKSPTTFDIKFTQFSPIYKAQAQGSSICIRMIPASRGRQLGMKHVASMLSGNVLSWNILTVEHSKA